jgi:hypothetical protein
MMMPPNTDLLRSPASRLLRWCPVAETWQDEGDPMCMWDQCVGFKATHRLRLRRVLLCSVCEMAFFTKEGFDGHECYSAY